MVNHYGEYVFLIVLKIANQAPQLQEEDIGIIDEDLKDEKRELNCFKLFLLNQCMK